MKEFIENYKAMFPLFEKHGFKNPVVYRRIKGRDSDKVLILVEDIYTSENEPDGQPHRKLHLADSLREKMSCGLMLLTREYLMPELRITEKLESGEIPSVTLSAELSSEELAKRLVEIFGKEWVFGKSPLASSQESKTSFWGKESAPVGQTALEFLNQKAVEALQQNPSMAKAGFDEQLSYLLTCLNKSVPQRVGSPKVK